MPTPFQLVQADQGGGINQAASHSLVAMNEFSDLLNFYPFDGKLVKRPGRARVNRIAGNKLMGLFPLKTSDGAWTLLAGQPTSIAALNGNSLVPLTVADGHAIISDTRNPWRFKQYLDAVYAVRKNTGRVKVCYKDWMKDAGIAAPANGPVLTQGVNNGNLDPGAYIGVYTYGISSTGAESNQSPDSNTVGIAQGTEIDWTAFVPSSDPRVDVINLYRTTVNATGQYFLVATIPVASASFADMVTLENLGNSVSLKNGLPPARSNLIEVYSETLFLSDGHDLFSSQPGKPESFYGLDVIELNPDDGHEIRALHRWEDRLVVAKTNAVYYLTGNVFADFSTHILTDRCGCIAPDSMRSVENKLFWYDGANVYMATGQTVESITDIKIRKALDSVITSQREFVVGAIYPRLAQYRLSIPANGSISPNTELIYDYRSGAWTIFNYSGNSPECYGDFFATDYEPLIYAGMGSDGFIYNLNGGTADDGAGIYGKIQSRWYEASHKETFGGVYDARRGTHISLRRLMLHTSQSLFKATLSLFLDSSTAAFQSRNVTLNDPKDWKAFVLSNIRKKATSFSWQFEHTGTDGLEMSGAVLHGMAYERYGKVA
jgi:hypothetical protein